MNLLSVRTPVSEPCHHHQGIYHKHSYEDEMHTFLGFDPDSLSLLGEVGDNAYCEKIYVEF